MAAPRPGSLVEWRYPHERGELATIELAEFGSSPTRVLP